jgi:hypothetical protein
MSSIFSWWKNGGPDQTKAILGWILVIAFIGCVGYVMKRFLAFDSDEWSVFTNAKFAMGFIQFGLPVLIVVVLECISKGFTIGSILDLRRDENDNRPHPLRYLAATALILGFAYIGLESVKGTFFTQ